MLTPLRAVCSVAHRHREAPTPARSQDVHEPAPLCESSRYLTPNPRASRVQVRRRAQQMGPRVCSATCPAPPRQASSGCGPLRVTTEFVWVSGATAAQTLTGSSRRPLHQTPGKPALCAPSDRSLGAAHVSTGVGEQLASPAVVLPELLQRGQQGCRRGRCAGIGPWLPGQRSSLHAT